MVLKEPLIAFFDRLFLRDQPEHFEVGGLPVAFTLMVMNHAVTSRRWPVVGSADIPEELRFSPKFCKQDELSGILSIYHEIPELAPLYERYASPGECIGLETAAVWEPEHVEDRLRDHFRGLPNKWVEQLKIT
ncbi:immunity 26/phosphotriesterase HocA family protein [Sphingomonas ginsengisoli (ex An et al. 2013)]|nr:immunity 26/phosphotriesterase HocA family protein [Sphingomonas ginsengisoli An et al. 2013]